MRSEASWVHGRIALDLLYGEQGYNAGMSPDAQRLLDEALRLPPDQKEWLLEQLLILQNEAGFAGLEKEYGEPEAGYDEWARAHIEESLADDSPGVPHEQVMQEMDQMIQRAKREKLKETA